MKNYPAIKEFICVRALRYSVSLIFKEASMAGTGVMGKVSDDAGKEVMNEKLCRKS